MPFDADLISLHLDQIEPFLLDKGLMQPLAVSPGSVSPVAHRSLIQAEGVEDGLDRTSPGD